MAKYVAEFWAPVHVFYDEDGSVSRVVVDDTTDKEPDAILYADSLTLIPPDEFAEYAAARKVYDESDAIWPAWEFGDL